MVAKHTRVSVCVCVCVCMGVSKKKQQHTLSLIICLVADFLLLFLLLFPSPFSSPFVLLLWCALKVKRQRFSHFPHAHLKLHDIAAGRRTNNACSNILLVLVQRTDVAGVLIVVQHLNTWNKKGRKGG